MRWGTPVEIERRRRIRVAIWAYAYEILDISIVSDHVFDSECKIAYTNRGISTGNLRLDFFFSRRFVSFTSYWVHQHPEKDKLAKRTKLVLYDLGLI